MLQRFRDPRRVAGVLLLGGVVGLALRGYPERQAKADPPELGPAGWGAIETRTIDPDLVRRALIRYASLCEPTQAGLVASGVLLRYGNLGILPGPEATLVACALGAPPNATCAQIRECTGEKPGEPAPISPACTGVHVARGLAVGPPGSQQRLRATESCLSQGGRCYERGGAALCAVEACTPGETYACVPEGISLCTEGLRLQSPCPLGTTCGASSGSGVLGCNGTGPACSDDGSRCEGNTRVACLRDGFGKGREASIDCAAFGLVCSASGSGPTGTAACSVDAAAPCTTESTPWTCEGGLVKACVAGRFYTYACADLGMAGICQATGGAPVCAPP
jgi:hypothetical protein